MVTSNIELFKFICIFPLNIYQKNVAMYIFRIGSDEIVQFLIYKNSNEFFISKRRKEKLRKKGRGRENVSLYILMDRRRFVSK